MNLYELRGAAMVRIRGKWPGFMTIEDILAYPCPFVLIRAHSCFRVDPCRPTQARHVRTSLRYFLTGLMRLDATGTVP